MKVSRSPRNCIRKNADGPQGLRNSHEFRYTSDPQGTRMMKADTLGSTPPPRQR